jgi:hypothetical protein
MTLTDFLLARIAEDEDQARTFLADNHAALLGAGADFRELAVSFVVRVLAECEAKRRLIRWVQQWPLRPYPPSSIDGVLELLALPYADHPDYDKARRP